jgi:hypothetical protein
MSSKTLPDARLQPLSTTEISLLEHAFPSPKHTPALFRHRSTFAAAELSGEVTTLGWDTTYILRVSDVNSVLRTSPTVPKDFDQNVDPSGSYKVSGKFGSWQIGLGGSGAIIFLAIPITEGSLTAGGNSYDMSGSTAYISVKLKYIPQLPSGARAGQIRAGIQGNDLLEKDDLLTDAEARSDADPAVVVQNLTFSGPPPSTFNRALMIGGLSEWFNANIVKFAYIFATVNLNQIASDKEFQWLKPTYTGYGYFDGRDQESSYFGILCMTENRGADGLSNQIAPGSIPSGSRAGFNIAVSRYMEKVIFPGLVKGFPHATASSFRLTANNTVIENKEKIECNKIRVGAINYTPYIHDFVLQVIGDEIQVYTRTVTEISPGIRSVVENTSYQTIYVVRKPDGSQTLDFKQTRDPKTNSYIDKDPWVTITELIVSIAGAVAGIVAATVIKGVVKIILACVIIAIVFGLAAATPELIAQVAGGGAAKQLPSIDLMVLNSTAPVEWPGGRAFTLDNVFLNGAIQMGGNPHITPPPQKKDKA